MLHMALSTVNIISITQQHETRNLKNVKKNYSGSICYILKLNALRNIFVGEMRSVPLEERKQQQHQRN